MKGKIATAAKQETIIIVIRASKHSPNNPPTKFPNGEAAIQSVSFVAETFPRISSTVFKTTVVANIVLNIAIHMNANAKPISTV